MKFVLMLAGSLLGLAIGYIPRRLHLPRPAWWRILAMVSVAVVVVLAIYPPLAGSTIDAVIQHRADSTKSVPVLIIADEARAVADEQGTSLIPAQDARVANRPIMLRAYEPVRQAIASAGANTPIVVHVRRGESDVVFQADELIAVDPAITLPYIMGLEERSRILFFHVPMSWIATIAYLLSMIYGVMYLRKRSLEADDISVAMASVGTLYAILATVTGAVWAKFNWGSFWNWDPRQTSIFILLLIYGAYFLLRSTIEDPARRARLSSAYAIIAFATVPFLVFVLPRLLPGLHPGSADDSTAGPLLSLTSDSLNSTKQAIYAVALFAFTLVFFWLANLRIRSERAARWTTVQEHQS